MSIERVDKLIREKIKTRERAPEDDQFDREKLWRRMEHRLISKKNDPFVWWKLAAAALILLSVTYGIFYYSQSREYLIDKDRSKAQAETFIINKPKKTIAPKRNTVKFPAAGLSPQTEKKKKKKQSSRKLTIKKKGIKNIREIDSLPVPRVAVVKPIHTDTGAIIRKIKNNIPLNKENPVPEKPEIVYYKEIINTSEREPVQKKKTFKFSIPIPRMEHHPVEFAASRPYFIDQLKINISKK